MSKSTQRAKNKEKMIKALKKAKEHCEKISTEQCGNGECELDSFCKNYCMICNIDVNILKE